MSEKPILFSGPMVRAILDGRKTQTRRVLKGAWQAALEGHDHIKTWFAPPDVPAEGVANQWAQSGIWAEKWGPRGYNRFLGFSPYRPADRLWVRETWTHIGEGVWTIADARYEGSHGVRYQADGPLAGAKYWPSIHMPREFSRIALEVTGVKVERLQDISEADAEAEGVDAVPLAEVPRPAAWSRRQDFSRLWTSINGPGSWEANPWVVAIAFRVLCQEQASASRSGEGPPSACAGGPSAPQ